MKNLLFGYNAHGSALSVKWCEPGLPSDLNCRVFLAVTAFLKVELISMLIKNDQRENYTLHQCDLLYAGERIVFYCSAKLF